MEGTLHRILVGTALALVAASGWGTSPASAQARDGWTPHFEANVGYFVVTRDAGKILGSAVDAQIRTVLEHAPVYTAAVLLSGPSSRYSLRTAVNYAKTDARGRAVGCGDQGISGPGCSAHYVPTTSVSGFLDVLLHDDETGTGLLKYFVAGLGARSYSFDEDGCQSVASDPILFDVCRPMEEFLADQIGLVFRLGLGVRGRGGPIGWNIEVRDHVGRFAGSGVRGEGGTQNDFFISAGLSFPGR